MARRFSTSHLSWSDRFSLIDYYQPSEPAILEAFRVTKEELTTARRLKASGTFMNNTRLDTESYRGIFSDTNHNVDIEQPAGVGIGDATASYVMSATKRRVAAKAAGPQKRGRKGDKITLALLSVTETPQPVTEFIAQYGVSLAVLRQAKRFIERLDDATQERIGKVVVKQDRVTKQLMISRQPNDPASTTD